MYYVVIERTVNDDICTMAVHRFTSIRRATTKCNDWNSDGESAHAYIEVVKTDEEIQLLKLHVWETLAVLLDQYKDMTEEYVEKNKRWLNEWINEGITNPKAGKKDDNILFDPEQDNFDYQY